MAMERTSGAHESQWRELREAAQHKVDEPILASGLFHRLGGQASALGPFSGLATLVANGIGRRRAAGLPRRFTIAVTPTSVHAFEVVEDGGTIGLGDEVAVWRRAGLVVVAEETALRTRVTIHSAVDDERVVCSTGKDSHSRSVIEAMQEPVSAPI